MSLKFINLEFPCLFKGKGRFEASSKARNDVTAIIVKNYPQIQYVPIFRHTEHKLWGVLELMLQFIHILLRSKKNSVIFIQYPIVNLNVFRICRSLLTKFKVIALIHDLPSYRFSNNAKEWQKEIEVLNSMACLIVHSTSMEHKLQENGLKTDTIVLEVFDYLLPKEQKIKKRKNTIVFAGALQKSLFLNNLHQCSFKQISFNLYGGVRPNIQDSFFVKYKGKFVPDNINTIEGEWGLLWDGNSIENCEGNFGEYLTIIAPHKLSLYIACRLKIIVWEGSAMANLVRDKKIGIVIKRIADIESKIASLSEIELLELEHNVSLFADELRKGNMFNKAFALALKRTYQHHA